MDKTDSKKVFELLKNEYFVKWVQNPTEDSNHFWLKWIANHDDNQQEIETARKVIQSGKLLRYMPLKEYQYDQMLENIMSYAVQKNNRIHTGFNWFRGGSIAASIVLLLVSIYFLQGYFKQSETNIQATTNLIQKVAPNGSKLTTKLPDGSEVILNAGSTLSFAEYFNEESRDVYLEGEAFFEVTHNPIKPFKVHFSDQQVEVLGTSFNIRNFDNDLRTEVAVASGKVAYEISGGDKIILLPSEMGVNIKGEAALSKEAIDPLHAFGWKDGVLYFRSDTFSDIRNVLERWYGVEIKSPANFNPDGKYSGTFENATLNEVLTGLSFVFRFDFETDGSMVLITDNNP